MAYDDADTAKPKKHDGAKLQAEGTTWMQRIRNAEKREDAWRKDAEAAEKAFSCDVKAQEGKLYDFNILHSNVETIVPAIYNSTPIPDIRRRHIRAGEPPKPPQDQNPMAVVEFQQAMLAYQQAEQQDKDAKDFGDMLERAIAHQIDDNRLDTEIEKEAQDSFLSGRGIIRLRLEADDDGEAVSNERITFEAVSWRNFRMGPANRFGDVPWIAFRHCVPREVLELRHMDKDMVAAQGPEVAVDGAGPSGTDDDDIAFWEVWCEYDRTVKFIREHDARMLRKADDPLGLPGFYPIPPVVQPITLTGKLTPVCPFTVYKKLADELDLATKRIGAIMKGLKVRGLIAGNAKDIELLSQAGDNELVVSADLEALAQTGGLEKAVMWWPIETAIAVLRELYVQREMTKQAIYEITGISDIVRGATEAGETATAQQIKTQWGSLRIQKMQRMIERQVRDVFCMMADIIVRHFSPETLQQMTGMEITEGMMALMQQGSVSKSYSIDVESDSTVRADLTRQKGEMSEFLAGTGQFFGAMAPVVAAEPEMAEPMAEIYASFSRVFKLGKQAEDALERMTKMAKDKAGQERPNPEAEKAQAEMQAKQAELQMKAQEQQLNAQIKQRELELKTAEGEAKIQIEREKMELEKMKLALEQQRMAMEGQRDQVATEMELMKHRDELGERDKDRQAKSSDAKAAAGIPPDYSFEDDRSQFRAMMERMERSDAAIAEMVQVVSDNSVQLAEAIKGLAAVNSAPKRAVKGKNGEWQLETVVN